VKLLDSLLDAIVRLEGDALVMHVGEKPYVVTASSSMNAYRGPLAWGQVELSSRVLTFDAVSSMLGQILPADQQVALTEFGAIEHQIPSPAGIEDRFTVIAARGGEDVWVELRRRPIEIPQAQAPDAVTQASSAATTEPAAVAQPSEAAAVPAAPSVEAVAEPGAESIAHSVAEGAAGMELEAPELELVTDAQDQVDEHPAADVQLDTHASIVVAIPGQAAEEFALNAVPDNAIQVIDDEPQGVPTEEEVDAMLGATAAALLTSGLSGEVVADDDEPATLMTESHDGEAHEETEIDLTDAAQAIAVPVSAVSASVELPAAEPGWELSPPPVEGVVEAPPEIVEAVAATPIGTPLFSEEAVLAAAPPPSAPVEPVPAFEASVEPVATVEAPVVEQAPVVEVVPVPEFMPMPELASAVELTPVIELLQAVEYASNVVEVAPVPEHVSTVEIAPVVEHAPVIEPPQAVEYASNVVEVAPVPEYASTVEIAPVVEPAPVIEPPQAVEYASDVVEVAAVIQPPPAVDYPLVAELVPVVETPSFDMPFVEQPLDYPSIVEPIAAAFFVPESAVEEIQPVVPVVFVPESAVEAPAVAASEPAVEETSTQQDLKDRPMHAGGPPAVSEPTPQAWTPSAPEMPMEVTPELRRQEQPVTETGHWAAASPAAPSQETPDPMHHAEAGVPPEEDARQGVVVPLARSPIKPEPVLVPFTPSEDAALMRTLRVAAARGASTVYVVAQSKPMIRIDGEIGPLESEPTLTAADVDRLVMELAPPRRRDALQNGPVEWLCDVPEIGRVRCMTFRDHRGPGVLFRMFPPRAISADQLGLTPEVQALCQQADGLVLVTGARASGKSTLLNAFVDLINRTRSDHVVTIESQIGFVHESRRSFISQRESRGDADLAATFARAALREDPDVMMIEDLKSAELVSAALEAAESGRLVLASVPASSTIGALERLIEVFPADRRARARTSLATALRGVIAQVLLRRVTGGRIAAREILLNTPAVSQLVLEGKMFQLPVALDSGRRHGMVPLTDSLAAHVRDGTVQVAEAYRKALDRAALVALLKREGVDTSFAERLA
jgi:twitching motility protein PilT